MIVFEIVALVELKNVSGMFVKLHLLTVLAGAFTIPFVLLVRLPPIDMALSPFPFPQSSIAPFEF